MSEMKAIVQIEWDKDKCKVFANVKDSALINLIIDLGKTEILKGVNFKIEDKTNEIIKPEAIGDILKKKRF